VAYTYSVDDVQRVVRVELSGEFTREDLLALSGDLAADPRVCPDFVEIIDLSGVTTTPDAGRSDIRRRATTSLTPVLRRAFVAPQPAIFGLCRMFATFREMTAKAEPVGVFHTVQEAEEWLSIAGYGGRQDGDAN
jgi:hypothetical protein